MLANANWEFEDLITRYKYGCRKQNMISKLWCSGSFFKTFKQPHYVHPMSAWKIFSRDMWRSMQFPLAEQLLEGQKNYRNLSYSEKTERLKTLISHRSPPPFKQEQNNNNNVDCKQRLKIYLQKICDFKSSDIIQEEKPGRTTELLLKNQCKGEKWKLITCKHRP